MAHVRENTEKSTRPCLICGQPSTHLVSMLRLLAPGRFDVAVCEVHRSPAANLADDRDASAEENARRGRA